MSAFVVASLVPRLLDIHGDAQNAQVLAARAGWQGHDAEVVEVASPADARGLHPSVVTIGAGFDADGPEVLARLEEFRDELHDWVAREVPFLAVGLGWELLSSSVELTLGVHTTGLGLFSGRGVASERIVGTVAGESRWGRIVGYEYHLRDYVLGSDEQPLVTEVKGVGNLARPRGARADGAVRGRLHGTGIRGPVLARNPRLADHLIALAHAGHVPEAEPHSTDRQTVADDHAARANRIVLANMGMARADAEG